MKAYSGNLERVGNGSWLNGETNISVLKIGDKLLSDIYVQDRLYSFLDPGKEITLYIYRPMLWRKVLLGISQGGGGDKICLTLDQMLAYILRASGLWIGIGLLLCVGLVALSVSVALAFIVTGGIYAFFVLLTVKDYLSVKGHIGLGKES